MVRAPRAGGPWAGHRAPSCVGHGSSSSRRGVSGSVGAGPADPRESGSRVRLLGRVSRVLAAAAGRRLGPFGGAWPDRPRPRRPRAASRRRPGGPAARRGGADAMPGPRRRCRGRGRRGRQPRRASATFSRPWVPRAAQAGRPHCARVSQSKTPSASDGPRRRMSRVVRARARASGPAAPGTAATRSGSTARPVSQRTRPWAMSGTMTMPAKRSPRSVSRPESPQVFLT